MTNPNYTHITMIVDRSGSMQSIRDASEDGVNEFINANKAAPGECTLLLREFDDRHSTVYGAGPIADFTTYRLDPRGMTAMLDAIVLAVNTAASAGATYSMLTANTIAYRGGAGPMTMPHNIDAAGEVG